MDFKKIARTLCSCRWLFLFLVAEIVLVALLLPHEKEMVDIPKYSDKQKTVRLDMYNYGSETNTIKISGLSDWNASVSSPAWMLSDRGQGITLSSMSENWTLDFTAELEGDGDFSLNVRGMDIRDKQDSKRRIPLCVKIKGLSANGKSLLSSPKVVWHDSPFSYQSVGKNGDKIKIHIEWEPFDGE